MNIIEKSSEANYLAAMAVFQQMFNQKKGMYDVICSFIEQYIVSKNVYDFLLEDMYRGLNSFYNFKLPIAIIKSSLRKLNNIISKNQDGHYIVDTSKINNFYSENEFNNNKTLNDKIITDLESYIESKIKRNLSVQEKTEVFDGFCSFLMGDKIDGNFQKHISSFVLESSKNEDLKRQLDDINEGLIIYTGITSELDTSKLGSWKNELTLYLDQEILFHIAGYNGDFFKKQADDFLALISEINRKEKIIHLFYFDKVKREVEHFFNNAEDIVSGKIISNGTIAMNYVTKGRSEPGDIITEKAKFYSKLQNLGITCDEKEYFNYEENNKYCVKGDFEPMLSLINILRKGESNKPIQHIKYILITGTRATLGQAYSLIKKDEEPQIINEEENEVAERYSQKSLAKSLEDITKLFWFALDKNLGHSEKLTSFDVIHKAKIVLSSILNGKVKDNYVKLNKDFLEGNLTKEVVADCIDELRNKSILPEDIQSENVDFVLNLIEACDIEQIQNEKAFQQYKLQETQKQNSHLEIVVTEQKSRIQVLEERLAQNEKEKEENRILQNKKKRRNIKLFFIIKIIITLGLVALCIFLVNKFLIPRIKGDYRWMTLIGWISSLIVFPGLFVAFFKKLFWNPYKERLEKIGN